MPTTYFHHGNGMIRRARLKMHDATWGLSFSREEYMLRAAQVSFNSSPTHTTTTIINTIHNKVRFSHKASKMRAQGEIADLH